MTASNMASIGAYSLSIAAWMAPMYGTAGFDPTHAANRARLAYSAYVGFVQLSRIGQPRMSHEEFEAYIRDFIETLVPR